MNRRRFISLTSAASMGASILGRPARYILGADPSDAQVRYVAPEARNQGNGADPDNAAGWTDSTFWNNVEALLGSGDVVVNFTDGEYRVSNRNELNRPSLSLDLGHNTNYVTLQGMSPQGVTIMRHPDDNTGEEYTTGLMALNNCHNITLRNLNFTAPHGHRIGYVIPFSRCRNILVDSCSWMDMPNVYYGATGAHRKESHHIVFSNCRFIRLGYDSHAHMAYNAYEARGTHFFNCLFEDTSGDYVRFRSGSDYSIIAGCTFRSTGNYTKTHMPFISIPVFNIEGRGEVFGTHFMFFDNAFIYETVEKPDTRIAMVIHQSGYDPPNRRHLLDTEEADLLASGTVGQKRELLRKNLGIDTDMFHVYNNTFENVAHRGVYRCWAQYGADSRGGDGIHDIFDTFNSRQVAGSPEAALDHWRESGIYSEPFFEPVLMYPSPSSLMIPTQPEFRWQEVAYASEYRFQITMTNFLEENILLETVVTGNTFLLPFELEYSESYRWRVRGQNESMTGPWSDGARFQTQRPTDAEGEERIPQKCELNHNHPNPFNASTHIRFAIPEQAHVNLTVYNLSGQKMATLVNENRSPGWYVVTFNASGLASGMYIYKMEAGDFVRSRKMALVK